MCSPGRAEANLCGPGRAEANLCGPGRAEVNLCGPGKAEANLVFTKKHSRTIYLVANLVFCCHNLASLKFQLNDWTFYWGSHR